jgi:SAM-dependent methyltransferase
MNKIIDKQRDWENAFDTLDKRLFSADLVRGYNFWDDLENYINLESKILDYGCGKGLLVKHLIKKGYKNTFGTDPSKKLLSDLIQDNSNIKLMELSSIPFPDNNFDLVYCSGVLHHIAWVNLINVMNDVNRVLKSGGIFIYAEPSLTIMRRLGHLFVFSPLNKLSKGVKNLKDCLVAEWPTYEPWLVKEREFCDILSKTNFKKINERRRILTVIGTYKKLG